MMDSNWKPAGYPTVSPYLIVAGAERVIAFAEEAFGAAGLRRYAAADGSILHAEVRIGESVVMIGDAGGSWEPIRSQLHVYVEDVDAIYARALAVGGVSVGEPSQRDGDPDRRAGVQDPGGNTWWIATQTTAAAAAPAEPADHGTLPSEERS